jgi:NDP-sugar pyrophosphorylase family protein
MIRSAFVLGAGLGTRLKSLTAQRPKPLIPVANKPLITYAFDHLLGVGVERLVVNTFHRADAYPAFFPEPCYRNVPLTFRQEAPEVLETAGGIKNVEDLLHAEPFFVYNGDILSDLPLEPAIRAHHEQGNEVTLVLRSHGGPLQIAIDPTTSRITDIGGRLKAESATGKALPEIPTATAPQFLFTGIYIVNPEFLARIPRATKLSVIPVFLEMIRSGAKLGGVIIDDGHWWDLGTREQYLAVHQALAADGGSPWIHENAETAPGASISGATAIGAGARIGADVELENCLVWDGAEIATGSRLRDCIVTSGSRVSGAHVAADL